MSIRVKTVTLNTSTGTQDITVSGLGTCVAAMVYYGAIADGGQRTDGGSIGVGFTDGTTELCGVVSSENAVTTSDTYRMFNNTKFLNTIDVATGANEVIANFDSFITDGVRINITTASASTRTATFILFGSSSATNVDVGTSSLTGPGTIDITSVGFEPDVVFMVSTHNTAATSAAANASFSFGFAVNDGSNSQKSSTMLDLDNQATSSCFSRVSTDKIAAQGDAGWLLTIQDFDSSGFSLNPNSNNSDVVGWLAVKLGAGISATISSEDGPTSTGAYSVTTTGITPSIGFWTANDVTTADSLFVTDMTLSVSAFDSTETGTVTYSVEDNVSTMNCSSEYNSKFRDLTGGTTTLHDGTLSSFASDSMNFNFTTVPVSARKWSFLAIGNEPSTPGGGGGLSGAITKSYAILKN